jgi:uncharacterized tellurite resistance protein B-like protein
MFDRLLSLLNGPATTRQAPDEQLSVALLLLELARADFEMPEVERRRILELLAQRYGLDAAQAEALLQQAQGEEREAVSLFDYVQALNARLLPAGKVELMELLWEVAYADGRLDPHEEHLLRKLAGLLYVPDEDYIRTKLRVAERREARTGAISSSDAAE